MIWRGVKISDLIRGHWKDCNVPGPSHHSGPNCWLVSDGTEWTRGQFQVWHVLNPNLSLLAFILMAMQDKFMGGAPSQPRSASELLDWRHIPEGWKWDDPNVCGRPSLGSRLSGWMRLFPRVPRESWGPVRCAVSRAGWHDLSITGDST